MDDQRNQREWEESMNLDVEEDPSEVQAIPAVASLPRQEFSMNDNHHNNEGGEHEHSAAGRKRSLPTGPGKTTKHIRVKSADRGELLSSQVTSLEEILNHNTALLRSPPEWLKSQLRIEDDETILHYSIRKNVKNAALTLINLDEQLIHAETAKGVTPLILASQKGNKECVQLLLEKGAKVDHVTVQGTSAVLQASHFGHLETLKILLQHQPHSVGGCGGGGGPPAFFPSTINRKLIELSNFHHTTPLMRAAQEGHFYICKYLVESGALVNRKNRQCMTALMLASQRGHAKVCEYLINVGHADMDATTESKSTPLLVACKRSHFDTIRVLITAGCELFTTDSRGRTAHDIALSRVQNNSNGGPAQNARKVLTLLNPTYQVHCMRQAARQERSWTIMRMWNLLQKERASLRNFTIHDWIPYFRGEDVSAPSGGAGVYWKPSTMALLRTMTLPEALVQSICEFAPMPSLWETRISMLTKRALVNPNAALECALDMMDEVLEEGGILQAFDQACIPPPPGRYVGWTQWKRSNSKASSFAEQSNNISPLQRRERPNATIARVPAPSPSSPSLVELRRHVGYLPVLSAHASVVIPILTVAPYHLPPILSHQLVTSSDIASLVRRVGSCGGAHFDTPVALDLIMLTSRLCSWYYSKSSDREIS